MLGGRCAAACRPADRSFGRSTPFVLVGVETPPPRSRHDTPPRTASRSAWDARSSPWLPWSRAFASRFSSLPRRVSDLRLVLFRFGRLAPFPSPLHSLVTLGQEPDDLDEPPWRRPDDSSPVIRGPRSRSPFDSHRASAFAPAPALDHAATAFAFAFAFATPTKPPPPRYANDRRAKGDCPSERRSGAQSSLAPRSVVLFRSASFPRSDVVSRCLPVLDECARFRDASRFILVFSLLPFRVSHRDVVTRVTRSSIPSSRRSVRASETNRCAGSLTPSHRDTHTEREREREGERERERERAFRAISRNDRERRPGSRTRRFSSTLVAAVGGRFSVDRASRSLSRCRGPSTR